MKPDLRIYLITLAALALAVLLAANVPPRQAASAATVTHQKLAIPAYFYPGPIWTKAEKAASVVGIMIMNPASGPGTSPDTTYVAEVKRAQNKGILVLGYVDTANGTRPAATAKSEVDKYYTWYKPDGIFYDEADPSGCGKQTYYTALYRYVKLKSPLSTVVINPGTSIPECYMTTTDIMLNFEGSYSTYLNWSPGSWVYKYPSGRFWQLVYDTRATKLANAITLSKKRNAGWVYITNDVLVPDPWDSLPPTSYWLKELTLVK